MKYTTKLLIGFTYPAVLTRQVVKYYIEKIFTHPDGKPDNLSFENGICVLIFNRLMTGSYINDKLESLDIQLVNAAKIISLHNNGVNSIEIPDIGVKPPESSFQQPLVPSAEQFD